MLGLALLGLALLGPTLLGVGGASAQIAAPAARPTATLDGERLAGIDALAHDYVDSGRMPGLRIVVLQGGAVVHDVMVGSRDLESGAPLTRDTIYRIYSMTKPVTGVAVMQLVERGLLGLDDPVARYLPELAGLRVYGADSGAAVPAMTIRHLLTHTSGLTYGERGAAGVAGLYAEADLWSGRLRTFVHRLAGLPLVAAPGTRWEYGVSMDVLGRVVEVVTGSSFDSYLADNILEPLGMVDTAFNVPEGKLGRLAALYARADAGLRVVGAAGDGQYRARRPTPFGGHGLVSTAADYARFAQMLARGGELDGVRVLEPASVDAMMADQVTPMLGEDPLVSSWLGEGARGLGFGLSGAVVRDGGANGVPGSDGIFFWGGAASTFFWVDRRNDLVVLEFTQLLPSDAYPIRRELRALVYDALDPASDSAAAFESAVEEARGLLAASRYQAAMASLDRAEALWPRSPQVKYGRAIGWLGLRRPGAAEASLDELVRLDPGHANGWALLGRLRAERDDVSSLLAATEAYERAAALKPADPRLVLALMRAYSRLGMHDTALGAIDAFEGTPGPLLQLEHARVLQRLGRTGEAREILERLVKAGAGPQVHVELGLLLENSGDLDGAARQFATAVRAGPRFGHAWLAAGALSMRRQRDAEAVPQLRHAVTQLPDSPEAQRRLGTALVRTDRVAEGIEHLREAVRLAPDDPAGVRELAVALGTQGDREAAARLAEQARRLDVEARTATLRANHDTEVAMLSAQGLYEVRHGHAAAAVDALERAARLEPEDGLVQLNLGLAQAAAGDHEAAVAALQRAADLGPERVAALTAMAISYDALGRTAEAAEARRRGTELRRAEGSR